MARAPDPRIEQAKAMYLQGAKLVEIASQLKLPEGTVRRWKSTHKWDSERSDKNSERSDRKKDTSKVQKAVVLSEVEAVIQNPDLSDKQRLFCIYYIRCFNATKAYQKAYGCDYITAAQNGSRMLKNAKVKAEIQRLKQDRLNREFLDEHDIFQKYMDIAFADMTDYVEFGREKVQVMGAFGPIEVENPKTGKKEPLMKEVNTVRFRESTDVDGTIIAEVKQGRDGATIKLADRMKALEWLTQHMNMATEEQKARIDVMRSKLGEDGNEAEAYDWMKAVIQEDGE
nr:MAG TPA: Terminase small subunit [Caudoviricetes sp.]